MATFNSNVSLPEGNWARTNNNGWSMVITHEYTTVSPIYLTKLSRPHWSPEPWNHEKNKRTHPKMALLQVSELL